MIHACDHSVVSFQQYIVLYIIGPPPTCPTQVTHTVHTMNVWLCYSYIICDETAAHLTSECIIWISALASTTGTSGASLTEGALVSWATGHGRTAKLFRKGSGQP